MRDEYYAFIKSQEIQDTLTWIEDMPYSKKLHILHELLLVYPVSIINRALTQYEENYVRQHRVISYMTRNILVNFCKTLQAKESK